MFEISYLFGILVGLQEAAFKLSHYIKWVKTENTWAMEV